MFAETCLKILQSKGPYSSDNTNYVKLIDQHQRAIYAL
jgi:hypothetical protein